VLVTKHDCTNLGKKFGIRDHFDLDNLAAAARDVVGAPRGVLADSFDRGWLLFTVQVYFFIVGILLAVLTAAVQMSPALLLAFTLFVMRSPPTPPIHPTRRSGT
jgi:hypothetical protein